MHRPLFVELFIEAYNGCHRHCTGCVVPTLAKRSARSAFRPDLALLARLPALARALAARTGAQEMVYHLRYGDLGLLDAGALSLMRVALGHPARLSATVSPTVHAARKGGLLEALVRTSRPSALSPLALVEVPYDPLFDTPNDWPEAWIGRCGQPGSDWRPYLLVVLTRPLLRRLTPEAFVERHIAPLLRLDFISHVSLMPMVRSRTRTEAVLDGAQARVDEIAEWLLRLFEYLPHADSPPAGFAPFTDHCLELHDRPARSAQRRLDAPSVPSELPCTAFHVTRDGALGLMDYTWGELPYGPFFGIEPPAHLDDPDPAGRLLATAIRRQRRRERALAAHPKCGPCTWRSACAFSPWELYRARGLDDRFSRHCLRMPEVARRATRYYAGEAFRDLAPHLDSVLW